MKILLIAINSKYIHPGMAIFQLKANSNYDVDIKEFTIKDDINSIIRYIEEFNPDLLGLSCYIWNISKIRTILEKIHIKGKVFIGGPEASYRPSLLKEYFKLSFIMKNESEETFNELVEYLLMKRKLTDVSNLYYKENNGIKYTYHKLPNIKNIKHDLSLIKDFENRIVYLEASRGCPFHCSYCLSSLDNKVRYFDIELVKAEILYAMNQKAKIVKFLDRSFNIKQSFMREVLTYIKNHNICTSFQFEIVPDLLDNETIALIKTIEKGNIRFEVGIQSTNDIVTTSVGRIQNMKTLKENINLIKDNIVIHADLIAGLPHEDLTSFKKTFNETFLLFVDELQLGFLKELQGTKISIDSRKHDYQFDSEPPYEIIDNKYITSEELDEIRIVERGLNRYYNLHQFPKTMNYLFNTLHLDPYTTFLKIINHITNHHLPFKQNADYAFGLYDVFKTEIFKDELLFIIKQDYLKKAIKPKIWWTNTITREARKIIYELTVKKYTELNLDILYRYSHLEIFNNQCFIMNYKTNESYFLII